MSRPATDDNAQPELVPVRFADLKDFTYFCNARTLAAAAHGNWYCKHPPTEISKLYADAPRGDRRINYTGSSETSCGWIEPSATVFVAADRVPGALLPVTEPPPPYRQPTGTSAGPDGTTPLIHETRLSAQYGAIQANILRASEVATESIGGTGIVLARRDRARIGLPEVLLKVLEGCGDGEAARLACEAYLERNPRPITTAPAFIDYHGYGIMAARDLPAGERGFIIIERTTGANLLPSGRSFDSIADAKTAIDVFRETGADGFDAAFEDVITS